MKANEFRILGKAFGCQIYGTGIMQTKSKIAVKLCEDGYLEKASITLPGRFPVTISGYVITIKGHMFYCQNC